MIFNGYGFGIVLILLVVFFLLGRSSNHKGTYYYDERGVWRWKR